MRVGQITDIHINGEYGGRFDVRGNFEKVAKALPRDLDLLVVTGDLADSDHANAYEYVNTVLHQARRRAGGRYPIRVLPGNHDSREDLRDVFGGEYVDNAYEVIRGVKVTYVDTSEGFVTPEAERQLTQAVRDWSSAIFTHYPLHAVDHRFMSAHVLKDLQTLDGRIPGLWSVPTFCGHLHYEYDSGKTHVCPASQCQIDPRSEEFNVSSYKPGFRVIELEQDGSYFFETFYMQY